MKNTNNVIIWYDGQDNYKKHTFCLNKDEPHEYTLELCDKILPKNTRSFVKIIEDILSLRKTKTVEILYSGGLDSEIVVKSCQLQKIPFKIITMRLLINGYPINTHDLYYSEKYCRENDIKQTFIDLDILNFFENGIFVDYLKPYYVVMPHVATHFWLLEQCSSFPIISGDYSWPWSHKPVLSPHRYYYSIYDKFLKDKNIDGIGNILNYSLELNCFFIKTHLEIQRQTKIDTCMKSIPIFKQELVNKLGLGKHELRLRSYGWETLHPEVFDIKIYMNQLIKDLGLTNHNIIWNKVIGDVMGAGAGSNNLFF